MTIELARPAVELTRRCALYRHFDQSDVLLYVGITDTLEGRTNGHARTSDWVRFAQYAEASWYDSREGAAEAEREAIRDETPVFNRQHALGDVDLRIAEYVRRRELDDLCATIEQYQYGVRKFLEQLPADIRTLAEDAARHDYRCCGLAEDAAFPASVLRHVTLNVAGLTARAFDEGRVHALRQARDVIGDELRAVLEPPVEESPF